MAFVVPAVTEQSAPSVCLGDSLKFALEFQSISLFSFIQTLAVDQKNLIYLVCRVSVSGDGTFCLLHSHFVI